MLTSTRVLSAAILLASSSIMLTAQTPNEYLMYVGTYTGPHSQGIYAFRFNSSTGTATPLGVAGQTQNPSFLAIHPSGKFLYAANETEDFEGKHAGSVSAFSIESSGGMLTHLNTVSSHGASPCFVTVDPTGKNLLVANYTGGSVAVLPIAEDGKLGEASAFRQHAGSGPNLKRQQGPHAHSINLSPDNRFAIVPDLGLDELVVYKFDAGKGTLSDHEPPFLKLEPGTGPRHFIFASDGKHAYAIDELASAVTVLSYDPAKGALTVEQTTSTLPKGFTGENTDAEVLIGPSGKFLYASNRGHNSIALFSIGSDHKLSLVEIVPSGGRTPRNFRIDPAGNFLLAANQNSNNVVIFKIDPKTGRLTPTGQKLELASPVCIRFLVPVKH